MSKNYSVETGVPPKTRFGGHGTTPRLDSKYAECSIVTMALSHVVSEIFNVERANQGL